MAASPITTAEVLLLRKALSRAGDDRAALLGLVFGRPVRSPKALREWHDLLLFLLAHPANAEEHQLATMELEHLSALAKQMVGGSKALRYALINSGIDGAPLQSTYSLRLVRWMLARWEHRVELFLVEAGLDELRELLRVLLPPVEHETVDQPFDDAYQLLETVYGGSRHTQLLCLVQGLDALGCDDRQCELLFARMQVYVKVEGVAEGCGTTFARGPMGPIHYHEAGLQRGVDLTATLDDPLPKPVRLSVAEQHELIDTARTVLAMLHRETDPVTHAGAVELFDMGRGLRIALFSLDMAHRLPFDSYVGFMAFRNGVPLAYGGAWIFPGRSKVGINIFAALRGGESAWFFAQLLRLYRQRYGVDRFEAENYQLGHHNPDGLKSGAYWFYYRLGFRPVGRKDQLIAAREFRKLGAVKGYRVPVKVLKHLVEHGLELVITEGAQAVMDTAALTMAVQRHVVVRYTGDRRGALRSALARLGRTLPLGDLVEWSSNERSALYLWALPLDMIPDLEQWSGSEQRQLVGLIKAKGGRTETGLQVRSPSATRLLGSWAKCVL